MKKQQLREVLARNLAAAMERKPGLDTQAALAKAAKMGQSHISRILNCSTAPTIDTIATLSEKLELQPWELLSDDDATREDALRRVLGTPPRLPEQPSRVVPFKRRKR